MKFLEILTIVFFLVSGTIQFTPNPIAYEDYYTADALTNYLLTHTDYWSPNSLFFQFDWYIPLDQVNLILLAMTEIYNKYGLNGIFLILDTRAHYGDITNYSNQVLVQLASKFNYVQDNMYVVILQYTPGDYGAAWGLDISISTGGSYARSYLSNSEAKSLINKWGPYLKYYTYDNVIGLIADLKTAMDTDDSLPTWAIILIVIGALLVLCCCGGGGYYYKKHSDAQTTDFGNGVNVNAGHF